MAKFTFLTVLLTVFFQAAFGQKTTVPYLMGYEKELGGTPFTYHSPIPSVDAALILRGQQSFDPVKWSTQAIPKNYRDDYVSFIWAYGMDVTKEPVRFEMRVNGEKWFDFSSPEESTTGQKRIEGPLDSELTFNATMLDRHGDQFGFAILKIPTVVVGKGEAAELSVTTPDNGNSSWWMTFRSGIEESISVSQNNVVVKNNGKLMHSVRVEFVHIGEETTASVQIGKQKAETPLVSGYNQVEVNLPKVSKATRYTASVRKANGQTVRIPFTLKPVKEWEIFLVQHTHSDIGYTRPQTEILPEHLRYIDQALDYCDQTDDYPEASQFRWTCETSWSVREYLQSRPQAQVDRLLQRIQEGRIEATGMFLNFSEIIDESALAAQTKTLRMLKNRGIDVTTAMQNDVNGIAWCMVDYYHHTDVRYLNMGIHAHRARKPFDKPTAFWWQSPAGNRLLAYRSEHYMHGNSLGLTKSDQDGFRDNLSQYLHSLEDRNYPYDKIALQFSGYVTDNSPPSVKVCDIIRAWNEKYEWPKLRSALARDFLVFLDEQHAEEIPAKKVAWPDWWTDGVASAANETGIVRKIHHEIAANTAILAMAQIMGVDLPDDIQEEIEEVYDNLLFYDEHTFGASESIRDPLAKNTINQWGTKASYAWEAAKRSSALQEKALAFLESALPKSNQPTIAVFNTLNWERSGMVEAFINYELIPEGADFTLTDADGKECPYQIFEKREEGAYYGIWVENIPGTGFKTLSLNLGEKSKNIRSGGSPYENAFYKITLDRDKGLIGRVYDKALGLELLDTEAGESLGQLIYEQLDNRHELERLTNVNRDTVYKPLTMERKQLSRIKVERIHKGNIFTSIFLHGEMPVCADERGVNIELRLYHYEKKIELLYRMFKLAVYRPEGIYVAFPFALENGELAFEAQGGVVYPGQNQLGGSASDWNTIQNFAAVKGAEAQILFVSDEIPLVQFGAINTGRYYYRLDPQTNHIYSWVLNNYWVTNFKASQAGELRWRYCISSTADPSDRFATQFGRNERVPLLSRIMLPTHGETETSLLDRSLIDLQAPNLLLVNLSPSLDGEGIVLHLRELEGEAAKVDIKQLLQDTGATQAAEASVLEEDLTELEEELDFEPYETKFVKLVF
jgi:alpha-mannosidase